MMYSILIDITWYQQKYMQLKSLGDLGDLNSTNTCYEEN